MKKGKIKNSRSSVGTHKKILLILLLPKSMQEKKSDKQLTDTAHWLVEQRTRLTELLIHLADNNRLTCS